MFINKRDCTMITHNFNEFAWYSFSWSELCSFNTCCTMWNHGRDLKTLDFLTPSSVIWRTSCLTRYLRLFLIREIRWFLSSPTVISELLMSLMQVELFITSCTERAGCKGGERRLLFWALLKTLLLCLVVKNFGLGDFLSNNFTRHSSLKES